MKTEHILSEGAKIALEVIGEERTRLLNRVRELEEMASEIYLKSNVRYILNGEEAKQFEGMSKDCTDCRN